MKNTTKIHCEETLEVSKLEKKEKQNQYKIFLLQPLSQTFYETFELLHTTNNGQTTLKDYSYL